MIVDTNVEEVRRVREMLIKKHGGLRGYIKHLQSLEKSKERRTARAQPSRRPTNRRQPTRRKRSA